MLTYTYACDACGEFEVRQAISESKLTDCPTCSGAVRRLISGGSGFVMKGKGSGGSFAKKGCDDCASPASSCGSCGCGHH